MNKYFLVGVANAYFYTLGTEDLVFQSKTMTDTAINFKIASSKINGGYGNKLQFVYFHTPELDLTLTDSQFNLGMLSATLGSGINTGDNVYEEEIVTLTTGGVGTVSNTPVTTNNGTTIYGWVTDSNGNVTKITFSGNTFTLNGGIAGQVVTVRYYTLNSGALAIDVDSDFIPSIGKLVIEAQLGMSSTDNASDSTIVGTVNLIVPQCQLDGTANITMKSSGVSTTPLKGMALSSYDSELGKEIYAKIQQVENGANWYDNVIALAITNNEVNLTSTNTTATLNVMAIPSTGYAFKVPDYSKLTFTTSAAATCTVDGTGKITGVATGSAVITVALISNNTITAIAKVIVAIIA